MKSLNRIAKASTLILLIFCVFSASARNYPKVLIFSKTVGYHHQSIATGITAIQMLGKANKFEVDTTTNACLFTAAYLKQYKAIIFLSPTGDVLNDEQQLSFEKYIQSGGGFVGIHAATDCEFNWPWYGNLVGAYFSAHPSQQEAVIQVKDAKNIATRHLPSNWKRKDEWYNFKWVAKDLHILLNLDEKSYDAGKGKMGAEHPIAWYHTYDGGRAFYTGLGHTEASYADPLFLKHLLGGIKYAMK
ncbi:ThuA domain-containing protein [Pedobacter sp. MC2016-14]|uniref:ThuA domain-containing protein n=1 Tax=Pedobacter sp. MC2016-14 TaxID=2897327 RepID=UPI001E4DEB85|nr:ThuA domain-containing protein [Pedobacter sp. MC2016-14]MCD0487619.1 ThuA domain-containing protein [Pedobacter sp. MC2016-14]